MKLAFKCSEACLFFDEHFATFVVVEKGDMDYIREAIVKDLTSIKSQDRIHAAILLNAIQKYKWTSIF